MNLLYRVSKSITDPIRVYKSVNEVIRQYRDELVVDAANGTIGVGRFRTLHNTLIDQLGQEIYREGLKEGGDTTNLIDFNDEKEIIKWQFSQYSHVFNFALDATKVNKLSGDAKTKARNQILKRVDLWVQSMNNLGATAFAHAQEGELAIWQFGDTLSHCKSCMGYSKYKPHRLSWWLKNARLPRSPELHCTGFKCRCKLISTKTGKVLYPTH
jgi:hypothetical protein